MTAATPLRVVLVALNAPRYQSLAIGYLQAYARTDSRLAGRVAFTQLDLETGSDPWWVAHRVVRLEPDVVGFSVTCWNAPEVYRAAEVVRRAWPGVRIVVGGPEVGAIAQDVLGRNASLDVVVRGEGEATFADLLDAFVKERPLWRVPGITYRDGTGEVRETEDRELIADLDSIPSPYVSGVLTPREGAAYIEGYRGCPHRCGYCFEGKGYGRIRHFSQARIMEEIDAIVSAGVSTFSFIDPVFNLTADRLHWIADAMAPHAARGVRLHTVEVDIERVGPQEAAMLKRAGVASVETGPQSVGQEALAACRRGLDRERFAAGVSALKAEGIPVECDLIVGLPGDTVDDVLDGMRFVVDTDPGTMQMSTLHVLPGTDLWERADELGLIYMPEAPHEIVRTRTIGFGDLRRLELLGAAVACHYGAHIEQENRPT